MLLGITNGMKNMYHARWKKSYVRHGEETGHVPARRGAADADTGKEKYSRKSLVREEELNSVWDSGEVSRSLTESYVPSDNPDRSLKPMNWGAWKVAELQAVL